jgi:hypothetical protein
MMPGPRWRAGRILQMPAEAFPKSKSCDTFQL